MGLTSSELILNEDGSIYHLGLFPHQLADTVITVGDPARVSNISKHFEVIEHQVQRREFCTHTGIFKGKRLTVISTGIGTDNIDIVFNELDALVNIDLENRQEKTDHKQLTFIRIGTSGSIQKGIPVDSFLISEAAVGFDSLYHWYEGDAAETAFAKAFNKTINLPSGVGTPYHASADGTLVKGFCQNNAFLTGITVTNVGFYAPQGRGIRLRPAVQDLYQQIAEFAHDGKKITNLEMETAGIYCLSALLGHRAISLNAILANRATGEFSGTPVATMEKLIELALEQILAF